jgi:CRISPR-associated endonuclease/helicase Cas3/CRISPR-associated endonuclease Cas3-HD
MTHHPFTTPLSHAEGGDESKGVLLTAHSAEVATRTSAFVPAATTPDGTPLTDLGAIIGRLHDFGKLSTPFQQYLAKQRPKSQETFHAPIGAAMTLHALDHDGYGTTDALLGFTSVAKHHGMLPDVLEYVVGQDNFFERFESLLTTQAADIDSHARETANELLAETNTGATIETFRESLRDGDLTATLESGFKGMLMPDYDAIHPESYDSLLALWSGLTLADKSSAAGIPESALWNDPLPAQKVPRRIDSFWEDKDDWKEDEYLLNVARESARQEALSTVGSLPVDGAIATLTLPTGIGKTLTGTQVALDHLEDKWDAGYRGRLVYALPFRSIIDQTDEVMRTVFDIDATGHELTVHHGLAETVTKLDDNDTDEFARREYLLGETWRSSAILTTFVQFFESLLSPRNAQSLKLSGLTGSVIILDEPQSLPLGWWPLVRRLFTMLTEQYDATVILMTATQPRMLDSTTTTHPLLSAPDGYFEAFERVEYRIDESVLTRGLHREYDEASQQLAAEFTMSDQSVLHVSNTIRSAQRLYRDTVGRLDASHTVLSVAEWYDAFVTAGVPDPVQATLDAIRSAGEDDLLVTALLTTHHPQSIRKPLLSLIRSLLEEGPPLFVCSTQLVEAGVDISFRTVYRDFAPIDSVVQAAGRCNRSFEYGKGVVTVWSLPAPEGYGRTPGELVYGQGNNKLSHTQRALKAVTNGTDTQAVSEAALTTTGVQTYFESLAQTNPGTFGWVTKLEQLVCDELSEVSLIDTDDQRSIILVRNADDAALVTAFREAMANDRYHDAEQARTKLTERQVSLWEDSDLVRSLDSVVTELADDDEAVVLDTRKYPGRYTIETGFS